MDFNYLYVNHTKKRIILLDLENIWKDCVDLLNSGWEQTDSVEIMHEYNDYGRVKYFVRNEGYSHDFGDDVFN
jgi:hypothetical protein